MLIELIYNVFNNTPPYSTFDPYVNYMNRRKMCQPTAIEMLERTSVSNWSSLCQNENLKRRKLQELKKFRSWALLHKIISDIMNTLAVIPYNFPRLNDPATFSLSEPSVRSLWWWFIWYWFKTFCLRRIFLMECWKFQHNIYVLLHATQDFVF